MFVVPEVTRLALWGQFMDYLERFPDENRSYFLTMYSYLVTIVSNRGAGGVNGLSFVQYFRRDSTHGSQGGGCNVRFGAGARNLGPAGICGAPLFFAGPRPKSGAPQFRVNFAPAMRISGVC